MIDKLLPKFLSNDANFEELQQLERWIKNEENKTLFLEYIKINTAVNKVMNDTNQDIENKQEIKKAIRLRIKEIERRDRKNRYKFLKYAAVIAVAFGLGYIFNTKILNKERLIETPIIVDNQVETGTYKATLTLENGLQIKLKQGESYQLNDIVSNGERLVYKMNKKVNDNKPIHDNVVYNYLTVPRGGQFFVQLSDSTKVWLNSDSQLKYPVTFKPNEARQVELVYGEAYFDVSPSTHHNGASFKVHHHKQDVEVLGTEFNIKAYEDEVEVLTTLVEGKVMVSNAIMKQGLSPNQQSIIDRSNNNIIVSDIDVYMEVSWREGVFSFRRKSLEEIMIVLSRWYDIDVRFEDEALKNEKFIGTLSKNQSIIDILSAIKSTNTINNYEINKKVVTLR